MGFNITAKMIGDFGIYLTKNMIYLRVITAIFD